MQSCRGCDKAVWISEVKDLGSRHATSSFTQRLTVTTAEALLCTLVLTAPQPPQTAALGEEIAWSFFVVQLRNTI
jgi:hypothetical protein